MKELYQDRYVRILMDTQCALLEKCWSGNTLDMSEDEFKAIGYQIIDFLKKYRPRYLLCDTSHFNYIILPDMQHWIDRHVAKTAVETGIVRMAYLASSDYIAQIAIEQSMDEIYAKAITSRCFTDEWQARSWLLQR